VDERDGQRAAVSPLADLALGPVTGVAAAAVALLAAVAPRYGWHRDELYFAEAGRHLDWGYVDQPPFTPLVARLAEAVLADNLVALRLLPALTTVVTVLLGALLARELGGGRRAQVLAAGAVAGGGLVLGVGHLLSTAAFDITAWMAMLWIAARLLRTGDPRWWVAFGAVAGLSLWNKGLVVLLGVSLAGGLLAGRRWDLLRSPWVAAGAALALLIPLPQLAWQAANGWPQAEMAGVLAERLAVDNRLTLLPAQLLFAGPLLVPWLWRGVRWLSSDPAGVAFRPLLWAWPTGLAATFLTAGRPYYVLPLTITVLVAGLTAADRTEPRGRLAWFVVANAALAVPIALPVLPVRTLGSSGISAVNEAVAETVGWPQLAAQVADVVDGLPPDEARDVVLFPLTYGEAGAIDRFGADHGLPPAHSPHNHYWYFRQPTDDTATVVAVRWPEERIGQWFDRCEQVAAVDNGLGVDNEVQGTPILVCRGLRGSWDEVWPDMKFLS
jgi:4-amino-4-deoxy-L-arabinose transferase-like glycosyltransferase